MVRSMSKFVVFLILINIYGLAQAQFLDPFSGNRTEGWFVLTGDGNAHMDFIQRDGYARIQVDATNDLYNVWWTLIKRDVTAYLDLELLQDPSFELRVEARVRISHAPRRVNFMLNTQRTTNYHEHLMEYDIADTSQWHTISLTTKNFEAVPGDTVYVQLCVTDFGPGKYYADIDYYRADIVDVRLAGPDLGEPLPYHPPLPEASSFVYHAEVSQDALINTGFPDLNLNDLHVREPRGEARILTVNSDQWAILRWDMEAFRDLKIEGAGLLELTTQAVPRGGDYGSLFGTDLGEEFGKIRVIEILGGDPRWEQEKVSYSGLLRGQDPEEVFNTQMIFDVALNDEPGSKNYLTISRPVMQRLIDGQTKGLLIRPLGAINASVYASENGKGDAPKLHFNATP